ncbi:hypothetical protein HK096_002392 [Nowakowskiella sp. JEL0078]|nr:hypothetical protein HK096_002392 [Nowakowskiella sp. JEL0078]
MNRLCYGKIRLPNNNFDRKYLYSLTCALNLPLNSRLYSPSPPKSSKPKPVKAKRNVKPEIIYDPLVPPIEISSHSSKSTQLPSSAEISVVAEVKIEDTEQNRNEVTSTENMNFNNSTKKKIEGIISINATENLVVIEENVGDLNKEKPPIQGIYHISKELSLAESKGTENFETKESEITDMTANSSSELDGDYAEHSNDSIITTNEPDLGEILRQQLQKQRMDKEYEMLNLDQQTIFTDIDESNEAAKPRINLQHFEIELGSKHFPQPIDFVEDTQKIQRKNLQNLETELGSSHFQEMTDLDSLVEINQLVLKKSTDNMEIELASKNFESIPEVEIGINTGNDNFGQKINTFSEKVAEVSLENISDMNETDGNASINLQNYQTIKAYEESDPEDKIDPIFQPLIEPISEKITKNNSTEMLKTEIPQQKPRFGRNIHSKPKEAVVNTVDIPKTQELEKITIPQKPKLRLGANVHKLVAKIVNEKNEVKVELNNHEPKHIESFAIAKETSTQIELEKSLFDERTLEHKERDQIKVLQKEIDLPKIGQIASDSKILTKKDFEKEKELIDKEREQNNLNLLESVSFPVEEIEQPTAQPQQKSAFSITNLGNERTLTSIRSLMSVGLHMGHSRALFHPHMLQFVYGERNGLHIINLEHTITYLRRAINVTREIATRGGKILFLGTRPSLHRTVINAAINCDSYYAIQWRGGTITNRERVLRRSVGYDPDKTVQNLPVPKTRRRSKSKAEEDEVEEPEDISKQPLVHIPDLLIVLDYPNNVWAVREANQAHVPIIALCDTNCDPRLVQYPIPANDDSLAGVELIAGILSRSVKEGLGIRAKLFAEGMDHQSNEDEEQQLDCALDLMRRLPPGKVEANLVNLVELLPELAEELVSHIDKPLKVKQCRQSGREYLLCAYNHVQIDDDTASYRSPWSNEFDPPINDSEQILSNKLRKLEIAANDAFDVYRQMYYEGGVSSVYMWDLEDGFAAVILIKKELFSDATANKSTGSWDSIHVFGVTERQRQAKYKLTSTIMLNLDTQSTALGNLNLSGSLTRQAEQDFALEDYTTHVANLGRMVEDMEIKMRSAIDVVYFGKTKDISNDLRSVNSLGDAKKQAALQDELVGEFSKLKKRAPIDH